MRCGPKLVDFNCNFVTSCVKPRPQDKWRDRHFYEIYIHLYCIHGIISPCLMTADAVFHYSINVLVVLTNK